VLWLWDAVSHANHGCVVVLTVACHLGKSLFMSVLHASPGLEIRGHNLLFLSMHRGHVSFCIRKPVAKASTTLQAQNCNMQGVVAGGQALACWPGNWTEWKVFLRQQGINSKTAQGKECLTTQFTRVKVSWIGAWCGHQSPSVRGNGWCCSSQSQCTTSWWHMKSLRTSTCAPPRCTLTVS